MADPVMGFRVLREQGWDLEVEKVEGGRRQVLGLAMEQRREPRFMKRRDEDDAWMDEQSSQGNRPPRSTTSPASS